MGNLPDTQLDEELEELEEDFDEELKEEPEENYKIKCFFSDLIFYTLIILIAAYIIPNFVLQRTIVDGASMEEALHNGDNIYVEKISYRFDKLDRFDIVVFYPYGREHNDYYVKRIIALPGETIQIKDDGLIYIDGELLEEDYGNEIILDPGRAAMPIRLAKDEYFVLGDNRNVSKDSRFWTVGNVNIKNIEGKVFFRISPLDQFGFID